MMNFCYADCPHEIALEFSDETVGTVVAVTPEELTELFTTEDSFTVPSGQVKYEFKFVSFYFKMISQLLSIKLCC